MSNENDDDRGAERSADIVQLACVPDADAMYEMVSVLFRYSMRGRVEVAWTDSHRNPRTKRHDLSHARTFGLNELEEMVEFACSVSREKNQNVYLSAGLRREDFGAGRAKGADIIAVAALKVDCDTEGCFSHALRICEEIGLRPSFSVFTGREPHLRGSLWWVLEEPDEDMARAEALEGRLARIFSSDTAVTNRDRVMRFAGSVAWPHKSGRVLETTGVYRMDWRAAPYTLDEIARAVGEETPVPKDSASPATDFSAARATHNVGALIKMASEAGRWHTAARTLTSHLLARGCPAEVIYDVLTPALTQPGYTFSETRADLEILVRGADRKGWAPQQAPPIELGGDVSPFLSIEDMLARPPPDYLIDGYLTEGGMSVLWGPSHAFKSFVALDLGLSVAHGMDWHGHRVSGAKPVLYICAEGQYGFGVRSLVWRENKATAGQGNAGFYVLPVPVNFLEPAMVGKLLNAMEKFDVRPGFIVVDTLARNFGAGDESKTPDMNLFVAGIDHMRTVTGSHVMVIHHTGKDEERGERGSYALRGAVDTSLKLSRDGKSERISLIHVKQKDGRERDDLALRVTECEATHPLTGEIVTSLLPMLDENTRGVRGRLTPAQHRVLALLNGGSGNLATLAARSGGMNKSNLRRTLLTLIENGAARLSESGIYVAVVRENGELNPELEEVFDHE